MPVSQPKSNGSLDDDAALEEDVPELDEEAPEEVEDEEEPDEVPLAELEPLAAVDVQGDCAEMETRGEIRQLSLVTSEEVNAHVEAPGSADELSPSPRMSRMPSPPLAVCKLHTDQHAPSRRYTVSIASLRPTRLTMPRLWSNGVGTWASASWTEYAMRARSVIKD